MSERNIEIVRGYHFDPKEIVAGLNGYYESDKRNNYITIKRNDVEGPAYLSTPIYLSALIEWLREDHDIFYRPGLTLDQIEAARSAAKMCCLRAHIKNEIGKRGIWCDKDADIPALVDTLFKAYDEEGERADENRKEVVKLSKENIELKEGVCKDIMNYIPEEIDGEPLTIKRVFHDLLELLRKRGVEIRNLNVEIKAKESGIEDLKEHITLLEADLKKRTAEIKEVNDQRWKDLRDIHKALGCYDVYTEVDDFSKAVKARAERIERLSRNAERETRKAVNDQLKEDTDYLADTLCDILEALGISKSNTAHLSIPELKDKAINRAVVIKSEHDRYLGQLDKAAADYQALSEENQKLKSAEKSDINKLVRDYCTKNGIIAPSRYFSDKACVEYLFSVIKLDRKDRAGAILYDLYHDIFHKDCTQFTYEDIATKILNKVLETEDLLHKSVDSVNKECKATGRMMVESYKLDLKDYILKDIRKHGYRYDSLETKSIEDIVDRIIQIATCTNKSDISDRIHEICTAKGIELDDTFLYDDDYTWEDLVGFLCEEIRRLKKEVEEAKKETKQEWYDYLWNALKELSPGCDALKIDHYEDLVDRIFYEMSFVNSNCKRCRREHATEKFDYIRRTNKAEEEVKNLRGQIDRLKGLINAVNEEVKDM